jgi:hypothetical protein
MPIHGSEPIGLRKDPDLSYSGGCIRQTVHRRNIVIVELGVVPSRHGQLGQPIHWSGCLPIDQRGGPALPRDNVPRCSIAMADDVRRSYLSAEPGAPDGGFGWSVDTVASCKRRNRPLSPRNTVVGPWRRVDNLAFHIGEDLATSLVEPTANDPGRSFKADLFQMTKQGMDCWRPRTRLTQDYIAAAYD